MSKSMIAAADAEFPDMRGFSADNVWRMRQLYSEYTAKDFLEQLVQEIANVAGHAFWNSMFQKRPMQGDVNFWHSLCQKSKFCDRLSHKSLGATTLSCSRKLKPPRHDCTTTVPPPSLAGRERSWLNQIKAKAYERAVEEKKPHNFPLALPEHLAEQADEMMKSRYNLESRYRQRDEGTRSRRPAVDRDHPVRRAGRSQGLTDGRKPHSMQS